MATSRPATFFTHDAKLGFEVVQTMKHFHNKSSASGL